MKKFQSLSLSFGITICLTSISFADVSSYWTPDTAPVSALEDPDIEMASENVVITISKDQKEEVDKHSNEKNIVDVLIFHVKAEFDMHNTGKAQEVQMYYPLGLSGFNFDSANMQHLLRKEGFSVSTPEQEIEYQMMVGLDEYDLMLGRGRDPFEDSNLLDAYPILNMPYDIILGPEGNNYYVWPIESVPENKDVKNIEDKKMPWFHALLAVFNISFDTGETKKIVVEYDQVEEVSPYTDNIHFIYYVATGASWKGNIGYGKITLQAGQNFTQDDLYSVNLETGDLGYPKVYDDYAVWEFQNYEPPLFKSFNNNDGVIQFSVPLTPPGNDKHTKVKGVEEKNVHN